jgi:hypothetical protein
MAFSRSEIKRVISTEVCRAAARSNKAADVASLATKAGKKPKE